MAETGIRRVKIGGFRGKIVDVEVDEQDRISIRDQVNLTVGWFSADALVRQFALVDLDVVFSWWDGTSLSITTITHEGDGPAKYRLADFEQLPWVEVLDGATAEG